MKETNSMKELHKIRVKNHLIMKNMNRSEKIKYINERAEKVKHEFGFVKQMSIRKINASNKKHHINSK